MRSEDLSRSACRVFGHRWGPTRYRAYKHPHTGKLTITRERVCERCKERERVVR